MSAEIWIGTEPKGYEERLLRDLHRGLAEAPDSYVLLSNFTVGGREIDLLTLKEGAIFLCECKWVNGPVQGGINGEWQVQAADGPRPVNACRENPYQQMVQSFYALSNWLEGHKDDFLSDGKKEQLVFRTDRNTSNGAQRVRIRSLLVFYPDLDPASELELDWKVLPLGYPALMPYVVEEQTARADLTLEEMRALAAALGLSPWVGAPAQSLDEHALHPAPLPLAAVMSQALGTCWHYLCLVIVNALMQRLQQRRQRLRTHHPTLPLPMLIQPTLATGQE